MIKMTWKQELLTFRCILVWWAKYLPCKQQIPTHLISLLLIVHFFRWTVILQFLKRIRGVRKYSTDMYSINFRNKGWKRTIWSWSFFYCILVLQAKATNTFPACCRWGKRLWLLSTKPISTIALNQDKGSVQIIKMEI